MEIETESKEKYYSISASEIAKMRYRPTEATEQNLKRGTELHELLQEYLYKIQKGEIEWARKEELVDPYTQEEQKKIMQDKGIERNDTDGFNELFSVCSSCGGVYDMEHCILSVECMDTYCLGCIREIDEQIDEDGKNWIMVMIDYIGEGKTPATKKKKIGNIIISYKPDIQTEDKIIEVKTCPIDDYAREQARVFSFCCGESIELIGWKNGKIEIELINGKNWEMPEIPKEKLTEIDECDADICSHDKIRYQCLQCEREQELYHEYEDEGEYEDEN